MDTAYSIFFFLVSNFWCYSKTISIGQAHELELGSAIRTQRSAAQVALLERQGLSGRLKLLLGVESDVANFPLDVSNGFALGGDGERVSTFPQVLDEEIGQSRPARFRRKMTRGREKPS